MTFVGVINRERKAPSVVEKLLNYQTNSVFTKNLRVKRVLGRSTIKQLDRIHKIDKLGTPSLLEIRCK